MQTTTNLGLSSIINLALVLLIRISPKKSNKSCTISYLKPILYFIHETIKSWFRKSFPFQSFVLQKEFLFSLKEKTR